MSIRMVLVALTTLGATLCARRAARLRRSQAWEVRLGGAHPAEIGASGRSHRTPAPANRWVLHDPWRTRLVAAIAACIGAAIGLFTIPVFGPVLGAVSLGAIPFVRARRGARRLAEATERQLAQLVESTAMAIRSGQSIAHGIEFAATEAGPPLATLLEQRLSERRLGVSLDQALHGFADAVGTEDAQLFVLVVGIQSKSGGNLAGALDEVASTIRHRIAIRRELRALSAQGRLSGAILGCLPIGFFLVLAVTSRRELEPVFRSPAGIVMVSAGFGLQAVAYLWIRRLLRVGA